MKKTIFLIFLIILTLGIWQNCHAIDFKLLLDYPTIGTNKITSNSTIPELIKYIYQFSLLVCGIVALVVILIGAIQYVTSAGDSSKASEAKDRITSALFGVLILLASVLILRTINPDLLNLSITLPNLKATPPTNGYTKVQCVVSGADECESKPGTVIYKACVDGVGGSVPEMVKDCETRCKGEKDTPTGTKTCNHYSNKSGCKSVSTACVNP